MSFLLKSKLEISTSSTVDDGSGKKSRGTITQILDDSDIYTSLLSFFDTNSTEHLDITANSSSSGDPKQGSSNVQKIKFHAKKSSSVFLKILSSLDVEYGVSNEADRFLQTIINEDVAVAEECISRVFVDACGSKNYDVISNLLTTMSRASEFKDFEFGYIVAMAATTQPSEISREAGIRYLENAETERASKLLVSLELEEGWVNDYRNAVVRDLNLSNAVGSKN